MCPLQIFKWQSLDRIKQISIFCKVGSYRITSSHACCIFQFSKFIVEKYLKIYFANAILYNMGASKNCVLGPMKGTMEMEESIHLDIFLHLGFYELSVVYDSSNAY